MGKHNSLIQLGNFSEIPMILSHYTERHRTGKLEDGRGLSTIVQTYVFHLMFKWVLEVSTQDIFST